MSTITLEAVHAKQTELAAMIQQLQQQAKSLSYIQIDEDRFPLQPGEHYAGAVLGPDGKHLHHLVLMAQRPDSKLTWQSAMDWATSVGGALPTRQEQALLFANCKPHLKPDWHWSSESHADNASYAWGCTFSSGYQGGKLDHLLGGHFPSEIPADRLRQPDRLIAPGHSAASVAFCFVGYSSTHHKFIEHAFTRSINSASMMLSL